MKPDMLRHGFACGRPEWHVAQCPCGQLTLRLGPIKIEFSPEEFCALHRLIHEAMLRFQVLQEYDQRLQTKTAH